MCLSFTPTRTDEIELTRAMVVEKPSPLLAGICQTVLHTAEPGPRHAPQILWKELFFVHGELDSNGKPADAVYRQKEVHWKVMSQNFTNSHAKICHVDAHATLNDGVVVQVIGSLSNNN